MIGGTWAQLVLAPNVEQKKHQQEQIIFGFLLLNLSEIRRRHLFVKLKT
jgi:hypothetical protein